MQVKSSCWAVFFIFLNSFNDLDASFSARVTSVFLYTGKKVLLFTLRVSGNILATLRRVNTSGIDFVKYPQSFSHQVDFKYSMFQEMLIM